MSLEQRTLADLCLQVTDGTHDSPKLQPSGVPFIKAKHITEGFLDFAACDYITESEHQKVIARSKPEYDDILFTHIGASLGRAARVHTREEFSIKNVALFKPDPQKVVPRYLYYCVISPPFQESIIQKRTGSAQPFVGLDTLRKHLLRIHPDISHQRRIASILSAYDDLIENNTKRIEILEEMARSLYREWFVHFRFPGHEKVKLVDSELGKIPEGWEVRSVSDVAAVHRGRSYKSAELQGDGKPFLNLKNIARDGGFRRDGTKTYSGKYKEQQVARAGDIIMAVTDMTQERRIVAHPARVPDGDHEEYVFSMDLVRIEPLEEGPFPIGFLYSFFRDSPFSEEVKDFANGANVLHLSPKVILGYQAAFPTASLAAQFDSLASNFHRLADNLSAKNEVLRQTRDLLLPKLISGEIDVDALDLPEAS